MPDPVRSPPKHLTAGAAPPKSIGFLLDFFEDSSYHWSILRGAMDAASDRGVNLVCFAGGVLGGKGDERNVVFDLAKGLDGLMLLSGPIGNARGAEALAEFCTRFHPIPVCSLGVELKGASSAWIDNESGMRAQVEHLVTVHGIKRIGFIRGPELNAEADIRYRTYLDVLQRHGIAHAPELVAQGNFHHGGGESAVRLILGERKVPVHDLGALVSANDLMALEALEELARRGVRVPEQVAVAGFDDVEESRFALPPLTTVRQPLYEQGHASVRHLLERVRTGGPPERVVLRTEVIIRRSCGCLGLRRPQTEAQAWPTQRVSFESALLRSRQEIVVELLRASRGELAAAGAHWDDRLVSAFAEEVRGDKPDAFIYAYDDMLRRLLATGADPSVCNDVISVLRLRMLACLAGDPKRHARAEEIFQEVRIRTAHVLEGVHASRRMRSWRNARALGRASAAIALADFGALSRVVAENLPALGISRCFLAAYEPGPGGQTMARLLLAERPEARSSDTSWTVPVPVGELLRRHVLSTIGAHPFGVLPITYDGASLGLLVVELGSPDGYQYETLRELFTAVLVRERQGRSS
ncbi:MAG TPA: substrate-binding domain-containing protein [Polyangiaceae bacterium]|nr:substrate-binding domain-containing protein [Polyangiaceae bacterium]